MLITVDDIRKIRQIAKNIDPERVNIYIREAELLDMLPRIGAELYEKLCNNASNLTDNEKKFLDGGYYQTEDGEKKHFEGIKSALCYYSYSRFIRNHSLQTTPFGVVTKTGDDSSNVDIKTVAALSEEARKIAEEYLSQSLMFWDEVKKKDDIKTGKSKPRRKFVPIG